MAIRHVRIHISRMNITINIVATDNNLIINTSGDQGYKNEDYLQSKRSLDYQNNPDYLLSVIKIGSGL